jgi:hypothetical protein
VDPDELRDRLRAERDGTLNELVDRQAQVEAATRETARQRSERSALRNACSFVAEQLRDMGGGGASLFTFEHAAQYKAVPRKFFGGFKRVWSEATQFEVAGWEIGVDGFVDPGVSSDGPGTEPRIIVLLATGDLARSLRPGVFASVNPDERTKELSIEGVRSALIGIQQLAFRHGASHNVPQEFWPR